MGGKINLVLPDRADTDTAPGVDTGIDIVRSLRFHRCSLLAVPVFGFALVTGFLLLRGFLQIALLVSLLELALAGLLRRLL